MPSFGETFFPDPRPEKPDLNDVTASEAPGYYSAPLYDFEDYALWTEGKLGINPYVAFNLVPDDRVLPGAGISLGKTGEDRRGILSVGNPNLNYSREVVLPEGAGREIYDRIEGGIGPFGGYFMESQFPQGTGTEYGGSLNLGPFTLFGNRATTQQNGIPEADRRYFTNPNVDTRSTTIGLRGSGDVGIGTLSGVVESKEGYSDFPQFTGQESRRRVQDPWITRYNLGLKSDYGDKDLVYDIGGRWTDVRGVGTEPSLYGSFKWLDPLKLGGELSAEGGWRNPIGGESSADVGFRYTLPLGGGK